MAEGDNVQKVVGVEEEKGHGGVIFTRLKLLDRVAARHRY